MNIRSCACPAAHMAMWLSLPVCAATIDTTRSETEDLFGQFMLQNVLPRLLLFGLTYLALLWLIRRMLCPRMPALKAWAISRNPVSITVFLAGVLLSAPVFAHMRYDFGPWFDFFLVLIIWSPLILIFLLGLFMAWLGLRASRKNREKQASEPIPAAPAPPPFPTTNDTPSPGTIELEQQPPPVPKRSLPPISRYLSIRFRRALLSGLLAYCGGMLIVMLNFPVLAALLLVLAGFLPEWLGITTPVLDPMEQLAFWISFGTIPATAVALLVGFWPSRNTG